MQFEVHWSDVGIAASMMGLSLLLSLLVRLWRRKHPRTRTRRSRTHWEWMPFMFGLTVVTAELPRVLGASDADTSIADTGAHVLALTTVLMLVRTAVLLIVRAVSSLARNLRGRTAGATR
ncbi:hypothetical protein [Kitasatospora sp. NPDC057015]|uniref:hypothetical protein n=1 Tax=Kitasatospora sp. NPDC057015 TaxID=3346001 RepID=UPI0036258DCB